MRRPSTFSNIFSSETTVPIEAKFHEKRPWGGERKCSWDLGHMSKMALRSYLKKKSKIFFSKTGGLIIMELGILNQECGPIIVLFFYDAGLT